MVLSVREANPDAPGDVAACASIYNYYISRPGDLVTFEEKEVSNEEFRGRMQDVINKGYFWLLAVTTGEEDVHNSGSHPHDNTERIRGYAYANTYKPRSAYRFSCEDSVYIEPTFTRRGAGKMLLGELLTRLRQNGETKSVVAVLGTKVSTLLPSLPFCFDRTKHLLTSFF